MLAASSLSESFWLQMSDHIETSTSNLDEIFASNPQDLSDEYQTFCEKEKEMLRLLQRLRDEETVLLSAVSVAEQVSTVRQAPRKHEQQRQAMKKLEEFLMGDSSSEEDESALSR